jgi:hypothetical protein
MGETNEEIRLKTDELHRKLINGDITASAEIAEYLLPKLTRQLERKFPDVYDADMIDTSVADALLNYLDKPDLYDPTKQSLAWYLLMSAKGDLLNALRPRKIDENTLRLLEGVELNDDLSEEHIGDIIADEINIEEEVARRLSAVWSQIETVLADSKDREIAKLLLNSVRETEEYAAILEISHLNPEDQKIIVKRHKDRIKKALMRKLDQKDFRDDI